jgi:hypothetical protein
MILAPRQLLKNYITIKTVKHGEKTQLGSDCRTGFLNGNKKKLSQNVHAIRLEHPKTAVRGWFQPSQGSSRTEILGFPTVTQSNPFQSLFLHMLSQVNLYDLLIFIVYIPCG